MSRALQQPRMAKPVELRRKVQDTVVCVYCFKTIHAAESLPGRSGSPHNCAEKVLALQPGAPPPYN